MHRKKGDAKDRRKYTRVMETNILFVRVRKKLSSLKERALNELLFVNSYLKTDRALQSIIISHFIVPRLFCKSIDIVCVQ